MFGQNTKHKLSSPIGLVKLPLTYGDLYGNYRLIEETRV